jgi:hypothetical protein
MKSFVERNLATVIAALGGLIVASLVLNLVLISQVDRSSDIEALADQLDEARTEVEELRGSLELFSIQAGALQNALGDLGPTASAALDEAVAGLETFRTSTIEFEIPINERLAISTEFSLDRTIQVPIRTTLPINQTIDTDITIDGPFGIDIPLSITVPIVLDLPIDLTVDIPINETVPINASIPVDLVVPISIPVAGTDLAALAESLQQGLESLRVVLADLG